APERDLLDGVETGWSRTAGFGVLDRLQPEERINRMISGFSYEHPEKSVSGLVSLYKNLAATDGLSPYWQTQKLKELQELVRACSGLYFEATAGVPYVAAGDSLRININVINRGGLPISGRVVRPFYYPLPPSLPANQLISYTQTIFVPVNMRISQPYWLEKGLNEGHFIVDDQSLIGLPESAPAYEMTVSLDIDNQVFHFSTPVRYKYTDPVHGEVYQPLPVVPVLSLSESPQFVFTRLNRQPASAIKLNVISLATSLQKAKAQYYQYEYKGKQLVKNSVLTDSALSLYKNDAVSYILKTNEILKKTQEKDLRFFADIRAPYKERYQSYTIRKIEYSHIPAITYFYLNKVKVIEDEIITAGKKIGYI
ncbi:MAG TPA: hypothetical protein PLL71_05695, partial [Agriterribacter sp.]|nr:hypothetical protein [Agriterribacter sp.]